MYGTVAQQTGGLTCCPDKPRATQSRTALWEAAGSVTTVDGYGFLLVVRQKSDQSKGLSFRLFSSSEIVNLLPFGFEVKTGAFLHHNDCIEGRISAPHCVKILGSLVLYILQS